MLNIYGDYHTHTTYSDAFVTLRDNILAAIDSGMKEVAITDHGFNNLTFALSRRRFAKQKEEIIKLRQEFGDKISILHGIESDIIGLDGSIDMKPSDLEVCDVLVMGYHTYAMPRRLKDFRLFFSAYLRPFKYPSEKAIKRNTKAIIDSFKKYPIDILAHINHLLKVDCVEVAKAAADYGVMIELNEKHFDFSHEMFEKMLETGVNFIINSDGHYKNNIGKFPNVEEFLSKHSFDLNRIMNLGKRPPLKLLSARGEY